MSRRVWLSLAAGCKTGWQSPWYRGVPHPSELGSDHSKGCGEEEEGCFGEEGCGEGVAKIHKENALSLFPTISLVLSDCFSPHIP